MTSWGHKHIIDGPQFMGFTNTFFEQLEVVEMRYLTENQQITIENRKAGKDGTEGEKPTRIVFGPGLVKLDSPWENYETPKPLLCEVLDQDDYLIVRQPDGYKRTEKGPKVYMPKFGDILEAKKQSIQIPLNHYIKVENANNKDHPYEHITGPKKFYPSPFQTLVSNETKKAYGNVGDKPKKKWIKDASGRWVEDKSTEAHYDIAHYNTVLGGKGSEYYRKCIEVTTAKAVHILRTSGDVQLIDTPQFYTPAVGESVHSYVERNVMLITDFCMIKKSDGSIIVMNGENREQRAFFLKPFEDFIAFNMDKKVTIMSRLPTFISHKFDVRTSDKVVLSLDLRISYQIDDVDTFASNPLEEFYAYIRNNVQSKLVDRFSGKNLRQFMNSFADVAAESVEVCGLFFKEFGINILDVQILNYSCPDVQTNKLLQIDIETAVKKQNELRATQRDLEIQELRNEVNRRKKDLEVEMSRKDNEVMLEAKEVENEMRMKEMAIEIQEEKKKTELLEVRRQNELVEAEFAGKALGHEFREFCKGIDKDLTSDQKVAIWCRTQDLSQADLIYDKVEHVNIFPPESDREIYDFAYQKLGSGKNFVSVDASVLGGKKK